MLTWLLGLKSQNWAGHSSSSTALVSRPLALITGDVQKLVKLSHSNMIKNVSSGWPFGTLWSCKRFQSYVHHDFHSMIETEGHSVPFEGGHPILSSIWVLPWCEHTLTPLPLSLELQPRTHFCLVISMFQPRCFSPSSHFQLYHSLQADSMSHRWRPSRMPMASQLALYT